ncbi:histidine protein methyltransferase 1 homolog isoform X2 [Homarus americanus]|uniref:histidine protein methyltransferase 1 homolog isoform X2 n=1 Tax=Homarus americanus TaxID=6706 RepID=UPI001C490662|nr:histidine protein methyltransferase 1 homolog isoform X2 [Homarus americanus]
MIKYLNMNSAVERLKKLRVSTNLSTALTDHSDLVPAVYEGGLKVWECTWDLLHYFAASGIKMKGCRVLEVGCGAALPALYAAIHGAHITLQDYNEEVINFITIPNVILNIANESSINNINNATEYLTTSRDLVTDITSKASFFSGDWGDFYKLLTKKQNSEQLTNDDQTSRNKDESQEYKFDIILTSETIYNPNCHEKLLNLMTNSLKQDGVILLAAKSHYFGVGGGTLQFIDLVKCQDILNIQTTVTNTEGVKREILEMKLKKLQ